MGFLDRRAWRPIRVVVCAATTSITSSPTRNVSDSPTTLLHAHVKCTALTASLGARWRRRVFFWIRFISQKNGDTSVLYRNLACPDDFPCP